MARRLLGSGAGGNVTHWIVVADTAACRIFRSDELLDVYTLEQHLENAHVHPDVDELGPRGATQAGPGLGRSRYDRHTDPQDAERDRFAREVAHAVDAGLTAHAWERLVLVAPPAFLGDLRHHLSERAQRAVVASVHHDYGRLGEDELPAAVRRHLPDLAGR